MSAIGGVMMKRSGEEPDEEVLRVLAKLLEHRGPDDLGITVQGHVGFVHCHLALMPLEKVHQPITTNDKLMLMGDARIYHPTRLDMEQDSKYQFQTDLSCEVILPLYEKYGAQFAQHLEGMFATALFDGYANELILSRDALGLKPLYYFDHNDFIIFASELKALKGLDIYQGDLEVSALAEALECGVVLGEKTLYEKIYRVEPGQSLIFRDGKIVKRLQSKALTAPRQEKYYGHPKDICRAALIESFADLNQEQCQFNSFLVKAEDYWLASELRAVFDHRVNLFWPRFQGLTERSDDFELGRVEEVSFEERDFWNSLPYIAWEIDEPHMELEAPLFYKFSRIVPRGTAIVFSGLGGSLLAGDQALFKRAKRPRIFGGRLERSDGNLDILKQPPFFLENWNQKLLEDVKTIGLEPGLSRLQKSQLIALKTELVPGDLLTQDTLLSSVHLEARYPFLHLKTLRALLALPDTAKIQAGQTGYLMYEELSRFFTNTSVPRLLLKQRQKLREWFSLKAPRLGTILSRQEAIERLLDRDTLHKIFTGSDDKHFKAAWSIFKYALWHQAQVVGIKPVPDTLSFLSQR